MRKAFILATTIAVAAHSAGAEEIVVKGLRIGMPKSEIAAIALPFNWANFPAGGPTDGSIVFEDRGDEGRLYGMTIGGVRASSNMTLLKFRGGKLSSIDFGFDGASFELVKAAVVTKYPKTHCQVADLDNTGYPQPACTLSQGSTRLFVSKSLTDGFLMMNEVLSAADRKKAVNDI